MATCDNDHDPITFEGEFSALCPLCAMRLRLKEEAEAIKTEASNNVDTAEVEINIAEKERDEAQEKLDKMEEDRNGWKTRAEELQAELDKLKENK